MASEDISNEISEIDMKTDEIVIEPTDEALKIEVCQNPDGIELGEVELRPGLELANAFIYDIGLVFKLIGTQPTKRSKSFSVPREKAKASSISSKEIGSADQTNPPQCIIIKWGDFVNCHLSTIVEKEQKQQSQLEVLSYEVFGFTKKMQYKKRRKFLLHFVPVLPSNDDELQANWVNKIVLAGRKFVQKKYTCLRNLSDEELLAKKRVLVLLNPVSGKRTGLKIFHNEVGPFLDEAGIEYELFVTERAGHARERLKNEPLDNWDALLLVSGDGLLNEALNGLLSREDASVAIQKPLGIIPCGTGNAIEGAILHHSREFYSPLNATFVFVKGLYGSLQELDIGLCCQGEMKTFFCLAVNWGFSGDVDIESEVIRRIGDFRFILGTLWRVLNRRIYRADISYLPFTEDTNDMKSSTLVSDVLPSPKHMTKNILDDNGGEHAQTEISPLAADAQNTGISPKLEPSDDMSTWKILQGPFTNILVTLSPMISHDLFVSPTHNLGCGYFTLVNIPYENVSRLQILQLLGNMKDDNMEGFALFNYTKIKAFRLTPIFPANGYLVVDGEVVPYEPCSGEISGHKMLITSLFEKESQ